MTALAGRCGGLCGADGDRHPGDSGSGHHRQYRCRGADLHQPGVAADPAFVHRCQPGCGPAQPASAELAGGQRCRRTSKHPFWAFLDLFTQPASWATHRRGAGVAAMGVFGLAVSLQLKIGDTDPGAPELRADSRYNRDNAFIVSNYAASSDVYIVMIKTPQYACAHYSTLHYGRCAGARAAATAGRGNHQLAGRPGQDGQLGDERRQPQVVRDAALPGQCSTRSSPARHGKCSTRTATC